MKMQIPPQFFSRIQLPLEWNDIRFGYENEIIGSQSVIDFACEDLAKRNTDDPNIVAIACAQPIDSLLDLVSKIPEGNQPSDESAKKWAFVLAAFVAEQEGIDQLSVIETVYSTFDYPNELASFIRYMPMVGPDLGSKEANENRMLNSLKEFAKQIVTDVECENA